MKVGLFIFPVRFANFPPIDISYLSAYLKNSGHQVYVYDFNMELPVSNDCDCGFWNQEENQKRLFNENKTKIDTWIKDILDFSPDIVGISVWPTQLYFSFEFAKMIKDKRKETKIVFGGPWCSPIPQALRMIEHWCIDYVVLGEGEMTLSEIIKALDSKRPISGCFKKINGDILDGGWRRETMELDFIPFPDYDHADFSKYLFNTTYPILFNRGCSWNCSFCMHRTTWKNFRSRSPENILAEIQHCFSKYPFITGFYSCDHSMNSNISLLSKLCDLIIKHNIRNIKFTGFGQVSSYMIDQDFLKKLKTAGFSEWGIGIQTGSDRILKSMNRPHTAAEAETMLRKMYNQGMDLFIDFIIGYPEETESDFQESMEFAYRVRKYIKNISIAPYCTISNNDLEYNFKKYGIYKLNDSGLDSWESMNSTPAIRARRYKIMMDHLASLGISSRYSDQDREHVIKDKR